MDSSGFLQIALRERGDSPSERNEHFCWGVIFLLGDENPSIKIKQMDRPGFLQITLRGRRNSPSERNKDFCWGANFLLCDGNLERNDFNQLTILETLNIN